ncbi:MAG TPA: hypothetical protein PLD05_04780, partial [Thermogutta sp.]|nr:hypothetical protein [Thermogutta sp.]
MNRIWLALLGTVGMAVGFHALAETTYTYRDLLMQMVDPRAAAVLPEDGEFCKQWSSWDRASR